VTAVTPLDNTA